jgi:hypothetical protein
MAESNNPFACIGPRGITTFYKKNLNEVGGANYKNYYRSRFKFIDK